MEIQKQNGTENNIYNLYLWGAYLALTLPLLIFPPWFTPLGWGKTIVFRSIFAILFFLFLYQILNGKIDAEAVKSKLKSISPIFWLLSALFGIYLIATLFSMDIKFSLWGDPLRSGGFVNFSFYIFFAIFLFLVIKGNDFKKLLNFTFFIGILVSLVAIIQQFSIFETYFIPFTQRPVSTIGNPILLAIYLSLMVFLVLTFGIEAKNYKKKVFYFFCFLLFLFSAIVLTQTRAAFFGLVIGLLWFIFTHPKLQKKFKIRALITIIIIIATLLSLKFYLDAHLDAYKMMPRLLANPLDRVLSIFEGSKSIESRLSTWKATWQALKEKPILGWGPENFMVAFDKYHNPTLLIVDPTLPYYKEPIQWWDRAHNIILDTSIAAGLPTLIIYLVFFIVLLWSLQKAKTKDPENSLIHHGLQTTFLVYLTANLASFDNFDIYIVLFFLLGYSFSLISKANIFSVADNQKKVTTQIFKYKYSILTPLFFLLIWFIFAANFKPLSITKETNLALTNAQFKNCQNAVARVEKISSSSTIINSYLRAQWATILRDCANKGIEPTVSLIESGVQLYREIVKEKPRFSANWLFLGEFINLLIEEKTRLAQEGVPFSGEEIEILEKEANAAFEKAALLSPKRQEIYKKWFETDILAGEYEKAKEKAQKCIDLNPQYGACYWSLAIAHGYLRDEENFKSYLKAAKENRFDPDSKEALETLANLHLKTNNFRPLTEIYSKLIELSSNNNEKAQLLASLAFIYSKLGEFDKARETALKILEILPEAKLDVDAFLKTLP